MKSDVELSSCDDNDDVINSSALHRPCDELNSARERSCRQEVRS